VKPISRSQWNDGYGADCGPSRSDLCRRAFRPNLKFKLTQYQEIVGPFGGGKIDAGFQSDPMGEGVAPRASQPTMPASTSRAYALHYDRIALLADKFKRLAPASGMAPSGHFLAARSAGDSGTSSVSCKG